MDEHEYIVGLLKGDGISYVDNAVHVSSNKSRGYFISIGDYKMSGDTMSALNFMFKLSIHSDSEYGVVIDCERREK